MKSFPQIILTACIVLSTASAADLGSRAVAESSSLKNQVEIGSKTKSRRLDDKESWDNGTKVYNQFPNEGWWSGTITSFNKATGMYSVTWEDGSTDFFEDGDKIDQMVANAQNDPQNNPAGAGSVAGAYPSGAAVSVYEDGSWYDGVIVEYRNGVYTVKWDEDDEIEEIQAGPIIDQMIQDSYGDDDAPPEENNRESDFSGDLSVGTAVSYYDEDGWVDGQIKDYSNGVYSVVWEDGSNDEYDDSGEDLAELKQATLDAIGDDDASPEGNYGGSDFSGDLSIGTAVSYYDEDGWVDGQIKDYSNGVYSVVWEDGSNDEYDDSGDDLAELKQAALDAIGDDDAPPDAPNKYVSGPKFKNGTPVSDWEDGEWVDGEVINFEDSNYIVRWEDEDDVEYYDSANADDMKELAKMVEDGIGDDDAPPASFFESEDLWAIGTPVAVKEDDIVWYGKIDDFRQGEYSIAWDNGESEYLDNFDLVNQMVSNAALSPKQNAGMSAVGKFFLSLFIISVCVLSSVFGHKYYQKYQAEQKREREIAMEDGGNASFRDQPDELPKII